MIKFNDIRKGDYVLAESGGAVWQGEVTDLNHDEKQICINNGIQEFWFNSEDLYPITLDDARLMQMKFKKVENEDGTVKYMKDAFRILIPRKDDFNAFEVWYKDERRVIRDPIYLHQLQNHFLDMTKVHLTDQVV